MRPSAAQSGRAQTSSWSGSSIGHIERALGERMRPREGSLGEGLAALANRAVATRQIAFVLAYLGTRVLGQYDIALLSAEARPGQLLFVEENIRATARSLHVPLDDFRTWVALHETTHAFEFEAHPWLRPYLAERMERQLAGFVDDARLVSVGGIGRALGRIGDRGGGSLLESLLEPEQRRLFRETQTVMSLLEGFGDWVMDRVGAQSCRTCACSASGSRSAGDSPAGASTGSWHASWGWTSSWHSTGEASGSSQESPKPVDRARSRTSGTGRTPCRPKRS